GRYRICDLNRSFYSHFFRPTPGVGTVAQSAIGASSMRLFYDHPGANGKAFACVGVLRARRAGRGGSAEATFTLFARRRFPPLAQEKLPSSRSCASWQARPHMQIVCIPMMQKTAKDNKQRTWFRCIDGRSPDRYRSQRGGT